MPTTFDIRAVIVTPGPRAEPILYGTSGTLPSNFEAHVDVRTPDLQVVLSVVYVGHQPRLTELAVRVDPRRTITTSMLRQVLVDQLLQAAIAAAVQPGVEQHADVHRGAYRVPTDPEGSYRVAPAGRRAARGEDLVRMAADLYKAAVAQRSTSPTLHVAAELGYGRSQASRLIRAARDAGFLPAANTEGRSQ